MARCFRPFAVSATASRHVGSMLRAWRNEFVGVMGIGLIVLFLGVLVGHVQILLGAALIAYLGWHILNLVLLHRWVGHHWTFRLPVSWGVWEAVFDGLQSRQIRARRHRAMLTRSISEFRDAGAQLPDALVMMDENRRMLWFNAAAERLLGLRRPHDLGQDITSLIRHPALEESLAGAKSGRSLEIASPANAAWMLSLQTTASFGRSRQRMLIARDITSVYRVEQVRRDFITNVSHELRTPITVFRGYLEIFRETAENPDWAQPVAQLDEQAKRMQDLVDDLLLLSRLEMAGRISSVDVVHVSELLTIVLAEARALSGTNRHEFALTADPEVSLLGDKVELQSVFSNLIINAVRHTQPGTLVDVSWQGSQEGATFTVRDHGEGLAAHHLPRLTERFYRVDSGRSRKSGGTGLGLAIVKHTLEHYGAELRIASEPGQGSTFSCHFPGSMVDIDAGEYPEETYRQQA